MVNLIENASSELTSFVLILITAQSDTPMENTCFENVLLVILHVSLAFTLICCTQMENGPSAMAPCQKDLQHHVTKIYRDVETKSQTFLMYDDRGK
jgi:hypothetical protein